MWRWLIGAAGLAAIVISTALGGGEVDPPPRRLSVPWRISRIVADRYLYLQVIGGGCRDLASVEVAESERVVEATAWVIVDLPPGRMCTLELTTDSDVVILDRPLGERRIVPRPLSPGIDRARDDRLFEDLDIPARPLRCPHHPEPPFNPGPARC